MPKSLDACFDNTEVTDCHVQETRGTAESLRRLRSRDGRTLSEEEARNFFNPPAIVEVYLSTVISEQEIGLFYFHLGEMKHREPGSDVYFTGSRLDAGGTVLRFQAPTYEQIYRVLPVLLAHFRLSRVVDCGRTLPESSRAGRERNWPAELARIEAADPAGVWHFADRLAEGFGNFANTKIKQIRDGRHWAVRIDVATNRSMLAKLLGTKQQRNLPRSQQRNEFHLPGGIVRLSLEDRSMSQEIKAGGNVVAASGSGNSVSTGDVVFQQIWNESSDSIDLASLADELGKLRAVRWETDPDHDIATGNVAEAEKAAKDGDGPKAAPVPQSGREVRHETATKIGA